MKESEERLLFETWAEGEGYDLERIPETSASEFRRGEYRLKSVQMAWEAWKRRAGE